MPRWSLEELLEKALSWVALWLSTLEKALEEPLEMILAAPLEKVLKALE
jgi:hypothetical protein